MFWYIQKRFEPGGHPNPPEPTLNPGEQWVTLLGSKVAYGHGNGWARWGSLQAFWDPGNPDAESQVNALVASLRLVPAPTASSASAAR